jgi:hypothetical protein
MFKRPTIRKPAPVHFDSHPLHPPRGATLNGHCGLTALEVFGDQRDELLIRFAIDWSCSEPGEPCATFRWFKRTDAGVWLDLHPDNGRSALRQTAPAQVRDNRCGLKRRG